MPFGVDGSWSELTAIGMFRRDTIRRLANKSAENKKKTQRVVMCRFHNSVLKQLEQRLMKSVHD